MTELNDNRQPTDDEIVDRLHLALVGSEDNPDGRVTVARSLLWFAKVAIERLSHRVVVLETEAALGRQTQRLSKPMAGSSESRPTGLTEALAVSLLNLGVEVANAMPGEEPLLTRATHADPNKTLAPSSNVEDSAEKPDSDRSR